ncbi:NADP-dependent oxidoreductase [Aequorivita echinoideorum]|uniref:NADP-dependent oxidoreductase n=1 Tax=Aequorivita echinoideorum TaxID=1549647 RepID=A0ABS5S3U3_9FLAO|nr:NADP-dependent oxidoreductase [Aequorivita echinoideorum]MBT0607094.1 NADP-dependent oxidoreductase [Aequorivita echinoideorum]
MNQEILLKKRPTGKPSLKDFEFADIEKPKPKDGEILLRTKFVSVDPYLRGRMRDEESYIPPFKVGEPIESGIIAEVVESNNKNFKKGEFVNGMLQWKKFQTSNGNGLNKVDNEKAPLKAYLGVLGLTGMTAYLGLKKIGKIQKGETLLVSGAAGAVGSIVGQIGKIKGCKVVGVAGTDEKIERITEKFGFDEGINYKTTKDMKKAIEKACPDGVDVYFDNVGGEMLDAALPNMNRYGRIINCGAISLYNETETQTGPRVEQYLIKNSLTMQGFIVRDYVKDFGPAQKRLAQWMEEDKLNYLETTVEGFENIPKAFLDLFEGKNKGKMIVVV